MGIVRKKTSVFSVINCVLLRFAVNGKFYSIGKCLSWNLVKCWTCSMCFSTKLFIRILFCSAWVVMSWNCDLQCFVNSPSSNRLCLWSLLERTGVVTCFQTGNERVSK